MALVPALPFSRLLISLLNLGTTPEFTLARGDFLPLQTEGSSVTVCVYIITLFGKTVHSFFDSIPDYPLPWLKTKNSKPSCSEVMENPSSTSFDLLDSKVPGADLNASDFPP